MKKSLFALAAMAATAGVSAQSSVTLFGVVDVGMSRYSAKSSWYNNTGNPTLQPPAGQPATIKDSNTEMSQGNIQTSRIGFRGVEDLGGGLSAGFWLEGQINPKDGARPLNFNRRSTVSLVSPWGEARLGRDYTATFWSDSLFDPFGGVGSGISLINSVLTNLGTVRGAASPGNPGVIGLGGSDPYIRTANSVGYFLPRSLGGVYGQLQYAFPENIRSDAPSSDGGNKGRYIGGRIGYLKGPFDIAVSYGQATMADYVGTSPTGAVTGVTRDNKIRSGNLGASYNFGVAKLFAEVSFANDRANGTPASVGGVAQPGVRVNDKYKGALVGVTVPVGVGELRAAYSRVEYDGSSRSTDPTLGRVDRDASADKFALGYVHHLSKRTSLYATAAYIRIDNGEFSPSILAARTGGRPVFVSSGDGASGYAPRSSTGYDVGIRHAF